MKKLAKWIVKYRMIFAILFAILAVAGIYFSTLVKQNYDMTAYLPDDTDTSRGLAVMKEEFGLNNTVQLMLDVDDSEVEAMKEKLGAINGVELVSLDAYKGGKAHYILTLSGDEYSDEAKATLVELREFLADNDYALSGNAVSSTGLAYKLKVEIPIIMIIAVVIIFLVLLLTSHSWLEPLVFALVLLCAVLINMGSNIIFGEISYITFAVSAILQIALAMDYSIILLHGFTERKNNGMSKEDALIEALEYNMRPISSSGLTTIAGLISLFFMSFTIGFDIGMVLAKGILVSLLSVFLLMPSLIMIFSKALDKTSHKPISLGGGKIASFSISSRKVLPVIMVMIIAVACVLQFNNEYTFTGWDDSEGQQKIVESFGNVNQAVVIIENDYSDNKTAQKQFEDSVNNITDEDGKSIVKSINSWAALQLDYDTVVSNLNVDIESIEPLIIELFGATVGDVSRVLTESNGDIYNIEISRRALSLMLNVENDTVINSVYALLSDNGKVTLKSAVNNFDKIEKLAQSSLSHNVKNVIKLLRYNESAISSAANDLLTPVMADLTEKYGEETNISDIKIDLSGIFASVCNMLFGDDKFSVSEFDAMFKEANGNIADIKITEDMMNNIANPNSSELIKEFYASASGGGALTVKKLVRHISSHREDAIVIMSREAVGAITLIDIFKDMIVPPINKTLKPLLNTLKSTFVGKEHSRIILLMDLPQDGDATFAAFDEIKRAATENFGESNYVAGASMTVKDISEAFSSDLLKINLVTVLSILLIIAVLFRSLTLPVILVFVIQGAIWITMSIYAIAGKPIFFMSYIICMCIQMGATIDYGILISSEYRHNRATMNKKEAITAAVKSAMPTIFTSGLILIAAGFIIGFVSTVMPIYSIGRMLGLGTIISVTLILLLLPAILYIFDKPISGTTWDGIKTFEQEGEAAKE